MIDIRIEIKKTFFWVLSLVLFFCIDKSKINERNIPVAYEKLYKNLFIKSGVLCKKMLQQDKMVVMVPKSMKQEIMQQLHSAPISGH